MNKSVINKNQLQKQKIGIQDFSILNALVLLGDTFLTGGLKVIVSNPGSKQSAGLIFLVSKY